MFIIIVCGIDNPLPLLVGKRMAAVKGEGVEVGMTVVWDCRSLCVGLAQCLLPSCTPDAVFIWARLRRGVC